MISPFLVIAIALLLSAVFAIALLELGGKGKQLSLRAMRNPRKGFSDLLVYAALVKPGVVLNKDGALMAGWYLRGEDAASRTSSELARRVAFLNAGFVQRDAGWMFHYDKIRTPASPPQASRYVRTATEAVMAESRAEAASRFGSRFESRDVLVATYLPPTDNANRMRKLIIEGENAPAIDVDTILQTFESGLAEFEDVVGNCMVEMRRLGARTVHDDLGHHIASDELLEHLNACVNGEEAPVAVPSVPAYLDGLIASQDFYGGFRPRVGNRQIRVVTIARFPQESYPTILDRIAALPIPHRFSTRIILEDMHAMQQRLDERFNDWFGKRLSLAGKIVTGTGPQAPVRVNRDADRMADDTEEALAALNEGLVKFVWWSAAIVLMDEHPDRVDEWAREVRKTLIRAGFPSRIEEWNAVDALLGTFPGDGYHNVRKYNLHTLNVADLLPSTSGWEGRKRIACQYCPPDVEPGIVVTTKDHAPFALDIHNAEGVQHVLVVGPTGNGKTVLCSTLATSYIKTPADQLFVIDRDYSHYRTVLMLGGDHYDVAGDGATLRLCPFVGIERPEERAFAVELVETMLELGGVPKRAEHTERVTRAVELLAHSPNRSMTTFVQKLTDPTGELKLALRPYTLGGVMGSLFDGTRDETGDNPIQGFELGHLWSLKEKAIVPVLLVLFHRIERALSDQRRTAIVIEEAFLYLGHSLFGPKIFEWLKMLRKKHAGVILVAPSITDFLSSPICDDVIASCKTKIFTPNPDAQQGAAFYEKCGMKPRQIAQLAKATPCREYWFQASDGAAMIDLALTPAELAVFGGGGDDAIKLTRALKAEYPEAFPAEIFRAHGLERWAQRWLELDARQPRSALSRELIVA